MAILREQFKPVAQSYPVPDALCQLPGLDVVHFARLTVLKVDALAAQPQSTIIHGAFHLLIHVVELQSFCHADLALLVPPQNSWVGMQMQGMLGISWSWSLAAATSAQALGALGAGCMAGGQGLGQVTGQALPPYAAPRPATHSANFR